MAEKRAVTARDAALMRNFKAQPVDHPAALDTGEPTAGESASARPEPLSLDRAIAKLQEQEGLLATIRRQMIDDLGGERGQWKLDALIDFHGPEAIVHETWARLWRMVVLGNATDDAWGKALTLAMELATDSTGEAREGLMPQRRRDAAKRWVRHQRRSWAALPTEVLAWAPFEF